MEVWWTRRAVVGAAELGGAPAGSEGGKEGSKGRAPAGSEGRRLLRQPSPQGVRATGAQLARGGAAHLGGFPTATAASSSSMGSPRMARSWRLRQTVTSVSAAATSCRISWTRLLAAMARLSCWRK